MKVFDKKIGITLKSVCSLNVYKIIREINGKIAYVILKCAYEK